MITRKYYQTQIVSNLNMTSKQSTCCDTTVRNFLCNSENSCNGIEKTQSIFLEVGPLQIRSRRIRSRSTQNWLSHSTITRTMILLFGWIGCVSTFVPMNANNIHHPTKPIIFVDSGRSAIQPSSAFIPYTKRTDIHRLFSENPNEKSRATHADGEEDSSNKMKRKKSPELQRIPSTRAEREAKMTFKFLHGDDLVDLRKHIAILEADLESCIAMHASSTRRHRCIYEKKLALKRSNNMDPEYVYAHCMNMSDLELDDVRRKEWLIDANVAKKSLQQFNLQGLWTSLG